MLKAPITQDAASVRALDAAHLIHPFTGMRDTTDPDALRLIVDCEGSWLTDDRGTRVLDGTAGLWCVNVGYGRQELVDTAAAAMARFSFTSTFFRMANEPAARLSEKIVSLLGDRFTPGVPVVFGIGVKRHGVPSDPCLLGSQGRARTQGLHRTG